MSWTIYYAEELWCGIDEVEDLWYEEQEQSFREMAQYAYDCEYHAREIAVCVAYEDACWIPVVIP